MYDFTNNFSIKGRWWIPIEEDDKNEGIYGVLTFNKLSGLSLVIEGSLFFTKSLSLAKTNFSLPVVVGVTPNNYHITLFNLYGHELGSSHWIYTDLQVEYSLLCKEPFFAVENLGICKLNFSTNCFAPFLHKVSAKLTHDFKQDQITFTYKEQPPFEILKNASIEVYFFFYYGFKGLVHTDDFEFKDRIFLNFDFKEPISINQAVTNLKFYKEFFTFFSYRKVSFEKVNFFARDEKGKLVELNFLCKPTSSDDYYVIASYDILLNYEEIEDQFSNMFGQWLNNQATINSGLSLYMQTKYLKFPSLIQSFLNIAFAVETLHNTYFKNKSTFVERLKDLITKAETLLQGFIYDIGDFCKRVKQQRNFLAHNHSESVKMAIPEIYYSYFNSSLQMIYECNFLQIMGLDKDRISLYLNRHYTYQTNKKRVMEIKMFFLSDNPQAKS